MKKQIVRGAAQRGAGSHSIRSCNPWDSPYWLDKMFEAAPRPQRRLTVPLEQIAMALKSQTRRAIV